MDEKALADLLDIIYDNELSRGDRLQRVSARVHLALEGKAPAERHVIREQTFCACAATEAINGTRPNLLYAVLRRMHWNDKKLAVIEAKDLPLGIQTYSGDLLDAAILRYTT